MDGAVQDSIAELVRKGGITLLQYASEAFPWRRNEGNNHVAMLDEAAKAQQLAYHAVANELAKAGGPPIAPGAFPAAFTGLNFVSLSFLLPKIIRETEVALDHASSAGARLDESPLKDALGSLCEVLKKHVTVFQDLVSSLGAKAS